MLFRLCEWLQRLPWVIAVNGNQLQISIVWLVHYLGFFLLVGSIVFVDLRVLGLAGSRQSAAQLGQQVLPWMWLGLSLTTLSGFIMFTSEATAFLAAPVFGIKLLVTLLATIFGAIVQWNVPKWDRMPAMPAMAKCIAFLSLVFWIGAILAALEVPALTRV